jgi:thioredoxin reductase
VLVLDQRAIGGQAGASARIENYLGFPTGISGQALAGRAFNQALKFGAEVAIPLEVARVDCDDPETPPNTSLRVELTDGRAVRARTLVVASGARYRRPEIPNLSIFEGADVSYWASPIEAKLCEGEVVALVGGGNSAGQAVVFLAPKVKGTSSNRGRIPRWGDPMRSQGAGSGDQHFWSFAIGDVRSGSTKRVAAAVGEGAAVVAQIHTTLAFQAERGGHLMAT